MDTKFIETLLKVIYYGSYADAARHLHVTPAAVRGRVQALEAELGVTLVNRAGQKVAPTQACLSIKVVARHAKPISYRSTYFRCKRDR